MNKPLRKIRSFVRRDSRITSAQRRAWEKHWPIVGLQMEDGLIKPEKIFNNDAPLILEIGFGMGQSLLAMAKAHPDKNFIGIETHQPGIGALLIGIELQQISNIKIFYADAIEVLERCIPENCLQTVQIFFPDPWPKRRHHKRRLIQPSFLDLIFPKLKKDGTIHVATDWEDYARVMMEIFSTSTQWINLAGVNQFAQRSLQRPIVTKFEQRGTKSGREIWELQFGCNRGGISPTSA